MKEELLTLYRNHLNSFRGIIRQFPHDDLAGPLLISPPATYPLQATPLMFIGQETSGWPGFVDDPEKQMRVYENFDAGRGQEAAAFWNMLRKIESLFGNALHSSAWTNISKFDFYGGRSHGKYEKAIAQVDRLLKEEIRILAPKVALFFTGPHFDNRLTDVFNGLRFEPVSGWEVNHLCMLRHPDLPPVSVRSYHPRFLRLKSMEHKFVEFITTIKTYETVSGELMPGMRK